jgi:predicted esterase
MKMWSIVVRSAFVLAGLSVLARALPGDEAVPGPQIIELAERFLKAKEPAVREDLAPRLDASGRDPEAVVAALRAKPPREFKSGYLPGEHFITPELREKHPDDLLYIVVPESYRPEQATGLIVMLHGGSSASKREQPNIYMNTAETNLKETGTALGRVFAATGMIAVGPSAPWNEKSNARWCLPEADEYLCDVILEMQKRFNIDPNRVALMGHSMGGFGAYHHAQRQPDRFAVVLASAGAWETAYWPLLRGTPLWIAHGAKDAVPGKRPYFTDVSFARITDRLLTEQGIEHEYLEHPNGHSDGREGLRQFIERMPAMRRDAYYPHVVAATPRGWKLIARYEGLHNRWVSILETAEGTLTHDFLAKEGPVQSFGMPLENWEGWRLRHERRELEGASVDAVNCGDNRFEATTRNVKRFSLWLHPKMADFSRPVCVSVDGKVVFNEKVRPAVSTALRSFERRRDWGLIYPVEIELRIEPKAAEASCGD